MTSQCDRIEPLLSAWLDRSLRAGERAAVAAHLPGCPHCQAEVASLQRTATLLRSAPSRVLPPDVRAALFTSAVAAGAWPAHPPVRAVLARAVAAAVALLTALGLSAWALGEDPRGQRAPVPLDAYVSDHLQGANAAPVPVLVEASE